MGVDFSDYNNDGTPDIFLNALSLEGYALYKNEGGLLDDVSDQAGISRISKPYSGWGVKFVDLDNDGWKDLFVAQGHVMDTISIDFSADPLPSASARPAKPARQLRECISPVRTSLYCTARIPRRRVW